MRFGINLPAFEHFSDARVVAELAHEAEDAGWDGFFIWDHLQYQPGQLVADPWVVLTAIAMRTERIRFGPMVTPLARRRPWVLARQTATLDRLSGGRLILGVGLGGDWNHEYSAFGEPADDKTHAAMLDEGLEVLMGLWSGEPISHDGTHYTVHDAQFLPPPAQSPRIPIWVANVWPHKASLRRAARWDGVYPIADEQGITPEQIAEIVTYTRQHRTGDAPFDVVGVGFVGDMEPAAASARLRQFAEAGLTWWQEGFMWGDTVEMVRERIRQGPPKVE